jgi:hypothetical protein
MCRRSVGLRQSIPSGCSRGSSRPRCGHDGASPVLRQATGEAAAIPVRWTPAIQVFGNPAVAAQVIGRRGTKRRSTSTAAGADRRISLVFRTRSSGTLFSADRRSGWEQRSPRRNGAEYGREQRLGTGTSATRAEAPRASSNRRRCNRMPGLAAATGAAGAGAGGRFTQFPYIPVRGADFPVDPREGHRPGSPPRVRLPPPPRPQLQPHTLVTLVNPVAKLLHRLVQEIEPGHTDEFF